MKVAAALLTSTSSGASRQIASSMASTAAPSRISHWIAVTLRAGIATDLGGRRLEPLEPAATDDEFGAEPGETASHRGTKPGAAAGDQYPLSRQQAFFKHQLVLR